MSEQPYDTKEATLNQFHAQSARCVMVFSNDAAARIDEQLSLVLFHATWSGYSIDIGRKIIDHANNAKRHDLRIYVVDIDSVSEQVAAKFLGGMCHGYAESALVVNGLVVGRYRKQQDLDPFLSLITATVSSNTSSTES